MATEKWQPEVEVETGTAAESRSGVEKSLPIKSWRGEEPHKNGNGKTAFSSSPSLVGNLTITKRDGRVVPFDIGRIESAMTRCFASFGRQPSTPIRELARQVANIIAVKFAHPTVEGVQDIVEMVLQAAGEYEAAIGHGAARFPRDRDAAGEPRFLKEMIRLKLVLGDQRAAKTWSEVLKVQTGDRSVCAPLVFARHFTATGDAAAAKRYWDAVLSLEPDHAEARGAAAA